MEDEVVCGYAQMQLEECVNSNCDDTKNLDPKVMQINLTGFLSEKASVFMNELWALLLSAQDSP